MTPNQRNSTRAGVLAINARIAGHATASNNYCFAFDSMAGMVGAWTIQHSAQRKSNVRYDGGFRGRAAFYLHLEVESTSQILQGAWWRPVGGRKCMPGRSTACNGNKVALRTQKQRRMTDVFLARCRAKSC